MTSNDKASLTKQSDGMIITQSWYRNPTFVWLLKSTAINFILPFFNGVMLGLGEILANELVFKFGWFGASRLSPVSLGIRTGVSPTATAEYKKALQTEVKRLDKQNER
ncbi:outer membrane protein TOM13-domain-containing protein [Phycomyces nitens]|nr:outer membrane protein TOM13-domain-containing protein [Phycomyces nitens]